MTASPFPTVPAPPVAASPSARRAHAALVLFASVFFLFIIGPRNVLDHDLFHEMAAFRDAIQRGSVPPGDVFAFTPTVMPVVHHEIGSGAVFHAVVSTLGFQGLMALKALLVAGILLLIAGRARRLGASWPVFALLSILAASLAFFGFGTVRAQIFTIIFTALAMYLLAPEAAGRRKNPGLLMLLFLPAWLAWLNLHAGFVAGAGLCAACGVETMARERKWDWRWLGLGAAMAVLVLVNPYGVELPKYLSHALTMPRPDIPEWLPVWKVPAMILVPYALSLAIAAWALWRGGWSRALGILPLVAAAAAGGLHVRHLPLYAVVWLGAVPAWLEGSRPARALGAAVAGSPRVVTAVALALCLPLAANLVSSKAWRVVIPTSQEAVRTGFPLVYPAGAVGWLRERNFSGNLMTPFRSGAYVSWHLAPAVKVSLDGRYEVAYQPGVFERVEGFYRGQADWVDTLGLYPAQLVLARTDQPVVPLLGETAWRRVYDDGAFVLFARPEFKTKEWPAVSPK